MPRTGNTKQVFEVSEPLQTPLLGLILGYGATVPFLAGVAGAAVLSDAAWARLCVDFTVLWGAAILLFLAGVRRGLSFRTPGGPTVSEIADSMWYFAAGFVSLLLWGLRASVGSQEPAIILLLVGYASLIVLDVRAAHHLEAPPYFARLRPVQMLIPIASLGFLLILA